MKIAVIPARGGSKRIPRKNIRDFCGKPIIAYSIELALASGCFDRVIVSTDDLEIAAISGKLGAEVPCLRPADLADDLASTDAVFSHALQNMIGRPAGCEYACCIYPTCPLLESNDLVDGLNLLQSSNLESVLSITSYDFPIQQALKFESGLVQPVDPCAMEKRSQDTAEYFHDAGMFYWVRVASFLATGKIFSWKTGAIKIPAGRAQDINTPGDWLLAERKFAILNAATT